MDSRRLVSIRVNGQDRAAEIDVRMTLADALRDAFDCTGVHLGCEQGVCGACTILIDGHTVRSCLMLAVQADGSTITTIEGVAAEDGSLHPLQVAFTETHALQCGYCTPGMILTALELLEHSKDADEGQVRETLSGNLCRCTGYVNIVAAIRRVQTQMAPDG